MSLLKGQWVLRFGDRISTAGRGTVHRVSDAALQSGHTVPSFAFSHPVTLSDHVLAPPSTVVPLSLGIIGGNDCTAQVYFSLQQYSY